MVDTRAPASVSRDTYKRFTKMHFVALSVVVAALFATIFGVKD